MCVQVLSWGRRSPAELVTPSCRGTAAEEPSRSLLLSCFEEPHPNPAWAQPHWGKGPAARGKAAEKNSDFLKHESVKLMQKSCPVVLLLSFSIYHLLMQ